jgi:hypothetical protein
MRSQVQVLAGPPPIVAGHSAPSSEPGALAAGLGRAGAARPSRPAPPVAPPGPPTRTSGSGDDHPPWSRTQPKDGRHAAAAATSRCRLLPRPPRRRPRRAGRTPGLACRVAQRASAAAAARTPTRRPGSATDLPPANATSAAAPASRPPRPSDRAVDGLAATGPPPVPVVTVARPARPGPQRHRLRRGDGRVRTGRTPDGWTLDGVDSRRPTAGPSGRRRPQVTGHRTAGQPDPGRRTGWVDTACWTPATDAVACLLAGSTTATTPDRSRPAGRCPGQTPSGRATTRTAQQQGRRGTPRCHRWVWPPPRPSAAGGTPPSSWRLGALLSSDDYGSSVERAAHGQVLWRELSRRRQDGRRSMSRLNRNRLRA